MPVLVSCKTAGKRGLLKRLLELRAVNPAVVGRALEGANGRLEEYRLTLYEDMSDRAKDRAKRRLFDALLLRRPALLLAAGDMPLRTELEEMGFSFADGVSLRVAAAGKAILRVAAATGLDSSSLRLCIYDPNCVYSAALLPELVGLARCVTVVTSRPDPVEEMRERIMEEYGAGYMVTDEPASMRKAHIVLGVAGLSRLVRTRSLSRHSFVISLDPQYRPPETQSLLVADGFVFSLPEPLVKEAAVGVPQQEYLEALMREDPAFDVRSLLLDCFTSQNHIIPLRQIAKRVICLDTPT